jgi:hypothetical protein
MGTEVGNLHQSGEKVNVSGVYQLVEKTLEGHVGTMLTLRKGTLFPDHEGRAACWHLLREISDKPSTAPLHTHWQDES